MVWFEWDTPNREALERVVLHCKGKLCLFDFDGTLIANDICEAAIAIIALEGGLEADAFAFELLGEQDRTRLQDLVARKDNRLAGELVKAYKRILVRNRKRGLTFAAAVVESAAKRYPFDAILQRVLRFPLEPITLPSLVKGVGWRLGIAPLLPMKRLLEGLAESGAKIAVVTASHEGLVRTAVRLLFPELNPDQVFGVVVNRTDLFDSVENVPTGRGKVEVVMRQFGRLEVWFAAGDSIHDFPMLNLANKALYLSWRRGSRIEQRALHHGFLVQQVSL